MTNAPDRRSIACYCTPKNRIEKVRYDLLLGRTQPLIATASRKQTRHQLAIRRKQSAFRVFQNRHIKSQKKRPPMRQAIALLIKRGGHSLHVISNETVANGRREDDRCLYILWRNVRKSKRNLQRNNGLTVFAFCKAHHIEFGKRFVSGPLVKIENGIVLCQIRARYRFRIFIFGVHDLRHYRRRIGRIGVVRGRRVIAVGQQFCPLVERFVLAHKLNQFFTGR
jgi:hypothetical protein